VSMGGTVPNGARCCQHQVSAALSGHPSPNLPLSSGHQHLRDRRSYRGKLKEHLEGFSLPATPPRALQHRNLLSLSSRNGSYQSLRPCTEHALLQIHFFFSLEGYRGLNWSPHRSCRMWGFVLRDIGELQ